MELTGEHFPESCHVCLIYESEEQRQKIVSEYLAAGIKLGELVRYFTDKTKPETVRSWLLDLGVELLVLKIPDHSAYPKLRALIVLMVNSNHGK